jgi:hypothetical protein
MSQSPLTAQPICKFRLDNTGGCMHRQGLARQREGKTPSASFAKTNVGIR